MALGVAPIVSNAAIAFPWPGASADLDFVRRQYFYNGATRLESDFTTFTLNSAAFVATGLDVSGATAPDITLALAAKLNITMPPCVWAFAGSFASAPAALKTFFQFDDATVNERFVLQISNAPVVAAVVVDGNVQQSTQSPGSIGALPTLRFGFAFSAQLNEILSAANGAAATADVAATMPTVTTLRIGKASGAGTNPPAILSRLVIFSAVKIQADINQLSAQIRDTP